MAGLCQIYIWDEADPPIYAREQYSMIQSFLGVWLNSQRLSRGILTVFVFIKRPKKNEQ
jgi:hypothetical protein